MKNNIIISGIGEQHDEDCMQLAKSFPQQQMGIQDVEIQVAHRIGVGTNRAMMIRLQNPDDKKLIFSHRKNLKSQKMTKGKPFFINDQLPEMLAEEKRKERNYSQKQQKACSP